MVVKCTLTCLVSTLLVLLQISVFNHTGLPIVSRNQDCSDYTGIIYFPVFFLLFTSSVYQLFYLKKINENSSMPFIIFSFTQFIFLQYRFVFLKNLEPSVISWYAVFSSIRNMINQETDRLLLYEKSQIVFKYLSISLHSSQYILSSCHYSHNDITTVTVSFQFVTLLGIRKWKPSVPFVIAHPKEYLLKLYLSLCFPNLEISIL